MTDIRLSKSQLEVFLRCGRCFWLERVQGLKAPEGIRAGVPMAIDRVLKEHFDRHRAIGSVPPEVAAKLPAGTRLFPDQARLKKFRYWKSGPATEVAPGVVLGGALDELLVRDEGAELLHSMADYKSKARETNEVDTAQYYQTQADVYHLILNAIGLHTDEWAYFFYYAPEKVGAAQEDLSPTLAIVGMRWTAQVVRIKANPEAARALALRAAECLRGPLPPSNDACEQCRYVSQRHGLLKALQPPPQEAPSPAQVQEPGPVAA